MIVSLAVRCSRKEWAVKRLPLPVACLAREDFVNESYGKAYRSSVRYVLLCLKV